MAQQKRQLITRIVLLANGVPAAERSLAALAAGMARRAHGFLPSLLPKIETEDNQFAKLLAKVAMDPRGGEVNPERGAPGAVGVEPEPYSFVVEFVDVENGGSGRARVEVKVVTSAKERRDRELADWLVRPVNTKDTVLRTGLWVAAGQEDAAGSEEGDRPKRPIFLQHDLIALAENLLSAASGSLHTVVLSISGFEYYFLDAYRNTAEDPNGLTGDFLRPFELACNPAIVREIMLALIRQAPHFRQLVGRCAAWQRAPSAGRKCLALLQPISANGFVSDDGSPNVDWATGFPLLTQDGLIDDRQQIQTSLFPRTDKELSVWVPYLTADPVMAIILRSAGALAIECGDLDAELPKLGRFRAAAMS
jgi:hypothetical protein